jgi:hypothetical protein
VTSELIHFVFETVDGEEDFAFAGRAGELRVKGTDGFVALGKLGGDVDDEGGAGVGEGGGVENFVRAEWVAADRELFEAGEKAAFVGESGRVVMIRVAGFPVRNDDGARAKFADGGGKAEFVFAGGLDIGIGNAESAAVFHFENFCCESGFFGAGLGRAECAHFSSGEIEDARFVAGLRHFEESAAAGEFNVVGMCGDGEKVEVHGGSWMMRDDCMREAENVKTFERLYVRTSRTRGVIG